MDYIANCKFTKGDAVYLTAACGKRPSIKYPIIGTKHQSLGHVLHVNAYSYAVYIRVHFDNHYTGMYTESQLIKATPNFDWPGA